VSAIADGAVVRIHLGGGSLVLPRDQVTSIESGPSTVEEYRLRAQELRGDPAAAAARWLELARWARARGFDFGARDAALAAADLDPRLEGLDPLLRALGYELDEKSGRWFPYEEAMRRRGWVQDGVDWVPAQVAAARAEERRAVREASRREAEAARLDRLAALTEMKLVSDLAEPGLQPVPWWLTFGAWGAPVVWFPAPVPQLPPGDPGSGPVPAPAAPQPRDHRGERELLRRPPWSLEPILPKG
jgi:hypothetical protein